MSFLSTTMEITIGLFFKIVMEGIVSIEKNKNKQNKKIKQNKPKKTTKKPGTKIKTTVKNKKQKANKT